nr:unnamed protein product [Callosobruchus chinensis]
MQKFRCYYRSRFKISRTCVKKYTKSLFIGETIISG